MVSEVEPGRGSRSVEAFLLPGKINNLFNNIRLNLQSAVKDSCTIHTQKILWVLNLAGIKEQIL